MKWFPSLGLSLLIRAMGTTAFSVFLLGVGLSSVPAAQDCCFLGGGAGMEQGWGAPLDPYCSRSLVHEPGPIPTVGKTEVGVLSSSCPSLSLPFRCGACLPQTWCPWGGQVECPRLMPPAWWCPGLSWPSSPAHLLCVHVRAKSSLEPLRRFRRQHRQAISLMNRIWTQK